MSKFDLLRVLNNKLLTLLLADEMTDVEKRRAWAPKIKQILEALSAIALRVAEGARDEETLKEAKLLSHQADQIIAEMEEEGIPCRTVETTETGLEKSN